jgi:hypothetical protein
MAPHSQKRWTVQGRGLYPGSYQVTPSTSGECQTGARAAGGQIYPKAQTARGELESHRRSDTQPHYPWGALVKLSTGAYDGFAKPP